MRFPALVTLFLIALPLRAQESPSPLALELRGTDGGVRVVLGPFLESPRILNALESGLPVRVRIVTELWRDRTVDALEGRHEWRASVLLEPLSERYRVEIGDAGSAQVGSLPEARALLQGGLRPPLSPRQAGDYYYLARMEVETLSLSDLEELRRWLNGELGPAVGGEENVGSALGRGLRRLMVRILGLPVQRHQARTARFTWP